MESNDKSFVSKIDPRTKLVFILATGGIIIGEIPPWAEWGILLAAFLLLMNERKLMSALKFFLAFIVLWFIEEEVKKIGIVNGATMVILLCSAILRKFIPCIMAGVLFIQTTTISELMATAGRMKISYQWVIPFAVVVRFFPTLKEEWSNIRMAMKMRGIGISMEYVLVPLLSSSVRIGEELTAAALSRGLGSVKERSNLCQVRLNTLDYLIMACSVAFAIITYGNLC